MYKWSSPGYFFLKLFYFNSWIALILTQDLKYSQHAPQSSTQKGNKTLGKLNLSPCSPLAQNLQKVNKNVKFLPVGYYPDTLILPESQQCSFVLTLITHHMQHALPDAWQITQVEDVVKLGRCRQHFYLYEKKNDFIIVSITHSLFTGKPQKLL